MKNIIVDSYVIPKKIVEILKKYELEAKPSYVYMIAKTKSQKKSKGSWIFKQEYNAWEEPIRIDFEGAIKLKVSGRQWMEKAGKIAQEIQEVFPQILIEGKLVSENSDWNDDIPDRGAY